MIHGQQAGHSGIIKELATLSEEIAEMVADITSQEGTAQLLLPEVLDIELLPVDDDRDLLHIVSVCKNSNL